ncbi:MAG: hypothetical protein ACTSXU_15860 [Promethearchaeota archaeon]
MSFLIDNNEPRRNIYSDINIISLVIFTVFSSAIFLSQDWGLGSSLLVIPSVLGFFAIFFRVIWILKPRTNIPTIPLRQYPFGDENFHHTLFTFGYILSSIILIILGYELILNQGNLRFIFKSSIFILSFIIIACVHVSMNKIWLDARLELDYIELDKMEIQDELKDDQEDLRVKVQKTYVIWLPSRIRFNKFSILNLISFFFMLTLLLLEFISPSEFRLIRITYPGMEDGNMDNLLTFPVIFLFVMLVDSIMYIGMMKNVFNQIYNFEIDDLLPVLIKIEHDDVARDKIIRLLEKIHLKRLIKL